MLDIAGCGREGVSTQRSWTLNHSRSASKRPLSICRIEGHEAWAALVVLKRQILIL